MAPLWWQESGRAPAPQHLRPAKPAAPVASNGLSDAERERIEREAYQRGFAEGKNLGKEQATAEVQPVLERLSRSLSEVSALRPRMRREAEKDLVKLAIAIARRVLHRELTIDPESIEGLIKVALERLESHELSRVRAHPDQESAVRTLLERFTHSRKIDVIADKSLRLGDVVLETEHGSIDASVEAQLSEIERGFADRLQR